MKRAGTIILLIGVAIAIAACTPRKAGISEKSTTPALPGMPPVVSSRTSTAAGTNSGSKPDDNAAATERKTSDQSASHGQYETVNQEGQELRQGRYLTGTPGGKLVAITVAADPKTFNPWVADDSFSLELCDLLFRGLADIDPSTGEVIPDMAAELTIEPDKLTYKTRLRKGLKWSDGSSISAEDVAFTWNRIICQGYGNPTLREAAMLDGKVPNCTVEDELTNKFTTAKPSASFLRLLATMKIAPKHAIESIIGSRGARDKFRELWQANKDTSQMVTSGPFKLASFIPGEKVELERAGDFYMIDKSGCRLPYLDNLIFTIATEPGAVVLSLGKGEADLAQIRPRDNDWLSSQSEKQNFKLFDLGPSSSSFFLVFNLNRRSSPKNHKPYLDPVKSGWFNDTNFRQAVNHALDRASIVHDFFKKAGTACFSSEPQNSPFCNPNLKPFNQDLKLSQTLLVKSGFQKKADGHLYDKDGNSVSFKLTFAKNSKLYDLTARTIAADLKQLGIAVELQQLEATQVQDMANGVGAKDWEAQLLSVTTDPLDPNSSANVMRSNGRLHVFDQRDPDLKGYILADDARPWELRLDQIYEQASAEFDREKRKQLYFEAQKIIYDEAPFIYLVAPNVIVSARNSIKNFKPTPLSQALLGLHNVEEIFIEEKPAAPVDAKPKKPSENPS